MCRDNLIKQQQNKYEYFTCHKINAHTHKKIICIEPLKKKKYDNY